VVIGDIRPEAYTAISPSLDQTRTLFVPTNVASWDSHAALFKQAYEWSGERVDFFAANAGIEDQEPTVGPWDLDAEPKKPNLRCVEVNEIGVFYGLKLFIHYSRKTQRALKGHPGVQANSSLDPASFNPKMVITASCAALYPFPVAPQYNAAKHAVLALTRAVGKNLLASDNIAVNCIMPAYVITALSPPAVTAEWPKEYITPLSTLLRAYDELTDEAGKVEQDGLSDGIDGKIKAGQAVECVVNKLYYRKPVPYADDSQKFLIEQCFPPNGLWLKAMEMKIAAAASGVSQASA